MRKNNFILVMSGIVILILFTFSLMYGCGTLKPVPSVCDTAPSESVICALSSKTGLTVEQADILFQLVNYELLKRAGVKKESMLKFFAVCEQMLSKNTYSELAFFIINSVEGINTKFGGEIIIVSQLVPQFTAWEIPICDFDKNLLKIHIEKQKGIVNMF